MAINLLETIQKNLNYPPLQKIDPNTQEVTDDQKAPSEHRFSQAAIPAVLTGLYTYSGKDDCAINILSGEPSPDWVTEIFGSDTGLVVQKIAEYSYQPEASGIHDKVNTIAQEAISVIRRELKPDASMMEVKDFMSAQTTNFLVYLPEALHMGQVLKEESLDDNTNKMEGPVSSLMHKIGSAFSKPSNEEEVNANKSTGDNSPA